MGEFDNVLAPSYVVNGLNKKGDLSGFNQAGLLCTGGAGPWSIRGADTCITEMMCNTGGGYVAFCQAPPGGLGDGTKPPTGERSTKHFGTGTGDNSRTTLLAMCTANGTGMTMQSGGGGKDVIHIRLADGKTGIVLTPGRIGLYAGGQEICLLGPEGKTTNTFNLVQEPDLGIGVPIVGNKTAVG